ncbi:MAG: VWA domain-containing protein, partial [Candidatus Omnitrophica bacterium]|nr:VWA domain-containing protein [Candidatus Omnitrophota bacterium]
MRRRKTLAERFVERNLAGAITPSLSIKRKVFKISILTLAVLLSLLALMRPQWGFVWEEVKRTGLDILIAIDASKSMLAMDVKPNRLGRSKFAVKDLVKKLSGDRIGLIAFAGTAFLQCPLTIDYNGFLLALDDLNTTTIPRGGTSISSAIKEAIDTFKGGHEVKYKVLVIITDGEELEGDAISAANEASRLGIKIYCVGVGTSEGEVIQTVDEYGQRGYLADKSGNVVKTQLNEELLKKIAITTGGSYVRATKSEFGLTLLYDRSISRLEKRELEAKMKKRYKERFQIFLALAVFLLF